MRPFVSFVSVVAFFHVSEFLLASVYMRKDLSKRSWLISEPYCIAMLFACLEYWLETRFCGIIKFQITARHNFTHDVKFEKQQEHVLVTRGIYRYCRHPGYLGWFVWVIGTQLLLVNPVCVAGFSFVAWKFFSERIAIEEQQLQRFFGDSYRKYAAQTPTLIPFIR